VQREKYTGLQCLKDGFVLILQAKKNMVCSLRGPLNKGVRPLFNRVHRAGNFAFCLKMEDGYKMSDNSKCSVLKQFLRSQQSSGPISVTTAYHMTRITANLYSDTRSARNKQRGRMELLIYFPGDSQNIVYNT
jgi:hypothetical protein